MYEMAYPVIIAQARLLTIGEEYEEAAIGSRVCFRRHQTSQRLDSEAGTPGEQAHPRPRAAHASAQSSARRPA